MNDIERRTDKLAALRERVERLSGYEGELGTDIKTTSPETLLERSPRTTACRIDAVNMAVFGDDPLDAEARELVEQWTMPGFTAWDGPAAKNERS